MEAHEKKVEADRLAELEKSKKDEADKLAANLQEQAERRKHTKQKKQLK